MLKPSDLERLPDGIEKLMRTAEARVLLDIIRRIAETGTITSTADYQINRLYKMGVDPKAIKLILETATKGSNLEINKLYDEVIDKRLYSRKTAFMLQMDWSRFHTKKTWSSSSMLRL